MPTMDAEELSCRTGLVSKARTVLYQFLREGAYGLLDTVTEYSE
jgi:hypothetical protein